jgi:chorismate mutase-like protein
MTSRNPQRVEGWLQIPPESGLMKPRRGVWLGQGEGRQKNGGGQDTAGNDSAILIETGKGDKMRKMGQSKLLHELENRRKRIDMIDQKLLSLLNQRVRIAQEIGKIKKEMGKKIYDPGREKKVLERLKGRNKGPLKEEDLGKIFEIIMKVCRRSQA